MNEPPAARGRIPRRLYLVVAAPGTHRHKRLYQNKIAAEAMAESIPGATVVRSEEIRWEGVPDRKPQRNRGLRICDLPECSDAVVARGLCRPHYYRAYRRGAFSAAGAAQLDRDQIHQLARGEDIWVPMAYVAAILRIGEEELWSRVELDRVARIGDTPVLRWVDAASMAPAFRR